MTQKKEFTVIALGGSIIVPELSNGGGIDVPYLRRFRRFLLDEMKKGKRFIVVAGGGKTTRLYQRSAAQIVRVPAEDLDWIGIHATRLNAHLLRTVFKDLAHPVVIDHDLSDEEVGHLERTHYSLFVGSGWTPGWSTDYIAVRLTQLFDARKAIITGDTPFVYDEDPKKNGGAKPFSSLTWKEYRRMIPKKWSPGMSLPVDPVAARLAAKETIEVNVMDGRDLRNLRQATENKPFRGTVIS